LEIKNLSFKNNGGTAYEHNYSFIALIKKSLSDIGTLYGLNILYKFCYDRRTRNCQNLTLLKHEEI